VNQPVKSTFMALRLLVMIIAKQFKLFFENRFGLQRLWLHFHGHKVYCVHGNLCQRLAVENKYFTLESIADLAKNSQHEKDDIYFDIKDKDLSGNANARYRTQTVRLYKSIADNKISLEVLANDENYGVYAKSVLLQDILQELNNLTRVQTREWLSQHRFKYCPW